MMLGRNINLPGDLLVTPPESEHYTSIEYIDHLEEKMQKVHSCAREYLKLAQNNQKRGYDRKMHLNSYQEGDLVWLQNNKRTKGVSPKLQKRWIGPCLVIKKIR